MPDCTHPVSEPRPRDFALTLARSGGARPLAAGLRAPHRGRRLAALAAAVAVPAIAAPADWHGLASAKPVSAKPIRPMAFERAGDSFPGSALYYLVNDGLLPPPPEWAATSTDVDRRDAVALPAGPAARGFEGGGSGIDRLRALHCLTQAIYYEAGSQSDAGQRAVAQVVLNRVAHPAYPANICGVVYQGSERSTGCQFSFTCDGSLARPPRHVAWKRARAAASSALAGSVYAPVGLATHYHTIAVHPYWAPSLAHVTTIGAHIFYRWGGAAGRASAFRMAYAGGEPLPAPHRSAAGYAPAPDPVAVARAYDANFAQIVSPTPAMPISAGSSPYSATAEAQFRATALPQSGTVKPEYATSGQWIGQPQASTIAR